MANQTYFYLNIEPARISWLKFILEGYDGLAVLSTLDRLVGHVVVATPSSQEKELFALLESLSPELACKESKPETQKNIAQGK